MSTTIEDAKKEVPEVKYSPEEIKHRSQLIRELCSMRDARDQNHPELDGMTYVQYYESNKKKDLSFIPPKKNKQDIRIVTGTTREKDSTLLSTLLNMNLVPDITAFDEDDIVLAEYGDSMSDLVKKSREIEDWQTTRPIVYREMIAQGDVFVQELYIDKFAPVQLEQISWSPNEDTIDAFKLKERVQKVFSGAVARMINGKKVYLGNIRVENMKDQDQVAVANVLSRGKAESIYGKWDRWKNVPKKITNTEAFTDDGTTYKDWNLTEVQDQDKVMEIFIFDESRNRFMIMLNGVMMLPINYPLTAINPSGKIPISQGKLDPISDFAYSKSQPSKVKVDQAVLDEATSLMIQGFRQMRKPPMGTAAKTVHGQNIFAPGKITTNLGKGALYPIHEGLGLTNAEFSFYKMFKDSINEKTTNETYAGDAQQGDPTATQIETEKQQQVLKLGTSMDAVVNLERSMTWHRIQTLLSRWTEPVDELTELRDGVKEKVKKYRNLTVQTNLENGQEGIKMFRFSTDEYPKESEQHEEEEKLAKKYRQPVRVVYLDPEIARKMKCIWFIIVNPTPKSNDKLSQLLFVQNITTAIKIFGPEAMNLEYLKQRYATLINEDYSKLFKKMDIMTMLQQGLEATGTGGKEVTPGQASKDKPIKAGIEDI